MKEHTTIWIWPASRTVCFGLKITTGSWVEATTHMSDFTVVPRGQIESDIKRIDGSRFNPVSPIYT